MPLIAEILGQNTTDPNVKVYHTRYQLSEVRETGTRGDVAELGELGQIFLRMSGVVQVQVFPYLLIITKAELFQWDEISPPVEKILGQLVISQRQLIDVLRTINQERVVDGIDSNYYQDGPLDREQGPEVPIGRTAE